MHSGRVGAPKKLLGHHGGPVFAFFSIMGQFGSIHTLWANMSVVTPALVYKPASSYANRSENDGGRDLGSAQL